MRQGLAEHAEQRLRFDIFRDAHYLCIKSSYMRSYLRRGKILKRSDLLLLALGIEHGLSLCLLKLTDLLYRIDPSVECIEKISVSGIDLSS